MELSSVFDYQEKKQGVTEQQQRALKLTKNVNVNHRIHKQQQ